MNQRANAIDQRQLEYLYRTNFARKLDDLADELHRRLMEKLIARGHKGLKLSFAAVFSNLGFSGARLVEIAERAGMTKQAIGQIANEIEALGYIQRIPDASDGRAKNIVFTRRGRQLIDHSLQALTEIEQELTDVMGAPDFQQLQRLLDKAWPHLGKPAPE